MFIRNSGLNEGKKAEMEGMVGEVVAIDVGE